MSEPGDCRHCRDYRECIGKPWFNFAEIKFCIYQILWILLNADTLRTGHWPQDPDNPSDNLGQRSIKTEASFVKPGIIIAEVEKRLERTGIQAELLITQVEDGRTLSNLSDGAREVLMYVKGLSRKSTGFKRWLRKVYYRSQDAQKGQFLAKKVAP
jgi:hypothetical protein